MGPPGTPAWYAWAAPPKPCAGARLWEVTSPTQSVSLTAGWPEEGVDDEGTWLHEGAVQELVALPSAILARAPMLPFRKTASKLLQSS